MDAGELLTRGTVWLALSLYVAGQFAVARERPPDVARRFNTLGCAFFLAHVACAFHFFHHWSQSAAYEDIARQTAGFTGWRWGGGLYFNYLFALVWIGEVLWSWWKPKNYYQRPAWLTWAVRSFVLFMVINGAVVFVRGNLRWFGLGLCLLQVFCWWPRPKPNARAAHRS